jgi:predicted DsbA family dithiol-disulfide isomerase
VVTVVDFVDFECPFCRMTQTELAPLLASHRGQVRLIRRQVPLKMHTHAMDAARAACCADKLGQGEAMAEALFSAPVEELTPAGCETLARRVGLSLEPYRACVSDPATDALIAADKAEFEAAGGFALPTLWIGETSIVGAQPRERLEEALEGALAGAGS